MRNKKLSKLNVLCVVQIIPVKFDMEMSTFSLTISRLFKKNFEVVHRPITGTVFIGKPLLRKR